MPIEERISDEDDAFRVDRDPSWHREVRRELLMMACEVEKRALASNLIAWIVIALGSLTLPNRDAFVVPLALRIVAMLINRWGWHRLRRALRLGQNVKTAMRGLAACLFLAGGSWALVLLPILLDPFLHPARLAVGGGVLVALSLITSMLGSMRINAISFVSGFLAAFAIGMAWAPPGMALPSIIGISLMVLAILAFSFASSRQRLLTAQAIVDNRWLEEELADSLAHAEFLASRDPLTGLMNRRAFFECAKDQACGKTRYLLTIDLDHFKSINDRFGHPVGDKVLIALSEIMRDILRDISGEDHCAVRMGGEEFVMVIGHGNEEFVGLVAERLRLAISMIGSEIGPEGLDTSASIGMCRWNGETSIDDVLSRADKALYRAKERGRNLVVSDAA